MTTSKGHLKNYSARLTTRPIDAIQELLALHGALHVSIEYDHGQASALVFSLRINGREVGFKLPARIRNVEVKLYGPGMLSEREKKQAYVTGWANIRDWVASQVALIETGMVKAEEVFLPYMLSQDGKTTYYEAMKEQHFLLEAPRTVIVEEQD